MSDVESQIKALLIADQNCEGRVLGSTVRDIALLLRPKPESDDVLVERAHCAAAMEAVLIRLGKIATHEIDGVACVDATAFLIEKRRLSNAIESVKLGLHCAHTQTVDRA